MSPIRPENRHRYPSDWPDISRRIRFERAGGRCECEGECGMRGHRMWIMLHRLGDPEVDSARCPNIHDQPSNFGKGATVVLTTAHLDHIPENCTDDNLKAMCQGCHLHYDIDHHRETAAATRAAQLGAGMDPLFVDGAVL